eukprot:TRINITY_DN6211_c0_g1_i1.p2 TRINITY_DN6211_c0_g1~~TRINITY_DN6211_c0_g1_i1.p2  ORF type:complete len:323 (+),score=19.32 TRINITY_DN6211_c0_g1_i1:1218-2186(+)
MVDRLALNVRGEWFGSYFRRAVMAQWLAGQLIYVIALSFLLSLYCFYNHIQKETPPMSQRRLRRQSLRLDDSQQKAIQSDSGPSFRLFTTFGGQYSEDRLGEIAAAILSNAKLASVSKVYVMLDTETATNIKALSSDPKLELLRHHGQPTYKDLFTALASHTAPNEYGVVFNADIELDTASLPCLLKNSINATTIVALTRHPHPTCPNVSGSAAANPQLPNNLCTMRRRDGSYTNSADTFVVRAPIPAAVLSSIDHAQNLLGSENRMLYFYQQHGYTILNPCTNVKTYHRHCVGERNAQAQRGAARVDAGARALLPRNQWKC